VSDPEAIYAEVLTEEQGKGVTPVVAEGRAKAARQRAHEGSPHPKEPKWWPGSQPHLEGGEAAPAAEVAEVPDEVVEETPAPEPVPQEAAPVAEAAPPPAAAAPEPAAAPAAAAEPVAPAAVATVASSPAQLPPELRPQGVPPGTPTGNRLRPEDSVATETQLEGQQAVYQRKKLIEELVATGVPAVSVEREPVRTGGPFLVLAYIVIVALAIGFVVANRDDLAGGSGAPAAENGGGGSAGGGGITVTASGVSFDTDTITLPADKEAQIHFVNDDTVQHNIGIYDKEGGKELFKGDIINGGQEVTYTIPPLAKGEYHFNCDVHPSMAGKVIVE
jgi:plastocyanin